MPRENLGGASKYPALLVLLTIALLGFFSPPTLSASESYNRHDELFAVHFPNEEEGWACGDWGVIWHTGDGGQTWAAQQSGTDSTLSSIFFVDSQTGWAVGNEGTILHTSNGGRTWVQQESPVTFFHRDVFFVTPAKGWIASERTHILFTNDGGKSWDVQFSDEDFNLVAISFWDEKHGWAVGEYGFTYHTEDGGTNWVHQAGYFRVSDETGDIETGVFLFDVVALDAKTGLAVGADGVVTRTEDGGKTWNQSDGGIPEALFFGAAYDGIDTIVIGGKGAYLYSPDKGKSWKAVQMNPSMAYRWLYGFDDIGAQRFVAVGEEGAIYVSTSSGQWQRVNY